MSVVAVLISLLEPEARAQDIELYPAADHRLTLKLSADTDQWFRIERSENLLDWRLEISPLFGDSSVETWTEGMAQAFFRAVPIPAIPPPYIVGVVGDSTASGVIHGEEVVSGGWAEGLRSHTHPDTRILNAGQPGLSSRSFLYGRKDRLALLQRTEPAFVLVQFGQIDEFSNPEESKFTHLEEYRDNLREIVRIIREWGGVPILVTPLPWRVFNKDGSLSSTLRDRSEIVLEVARAAGAFSIDLHQILALHYQSIDSAELRAMSAVDQYHLSEEGAIIGARLLVDALPIHLRTHLFTTVE